MGRFEQEDPPKNALQSLDLGGHVISQGNLALFLDAIDSR